jgi:hypothetical protein
MVLRLLPDLLLEPVVTAFRSAQILTYPSALKWFLLSFAPEARVQEYWRRLQQSQQNDGETPTDYSLRLQMEAAKLGSLVTPAELKALFEGGLHETTRYFLRATLKPDPHRTLTDSVSAASALAQAISTQNKAPESTSTNPRLIRPSRRALWAADREGVETSSDDPSDLIYWDAPEPEFDPAEQTMACYGDQLPKRPHRSESNSSRLCWTCWLPGHFSEECPVIPDHLRQEILVRKRTALMTLRRQRANGSVTRPGWCNNHSYPPRDRPSEPEPEAVIPVTPTTPDTKVIIDVKKKEEGWGSESH